MVRLQSNVDEHDPEVCSKNLTMWEQEGPCKVPPKFVPFGMNVSLPHTCTSVEQVCISRFIQCWYTINHSHYNKFSRTTIHITSSSLEISDTFNSLCGCQNHVLFSLQTWKWVIGPVILYIIERLIRVYRSFQQVKILKVRFCCGTKLITFLCPLFEKISRK